MHDSMGIALQRPMRRGNVPADLTGQRRPPLHRDGENRTRFRAHIPEVDEVGGLRRVEYEVFRVVPPCWLLFEPMRRESERGDTVFHVDLDPDVRGCLYDGRLEDVAVSASEVG